MSPGRARIRPGTLLLAIPGLLFVPGDVRAQRLQDRVFPDEGPAPVAPDWRPAAASTLLPGAGQFILHQRRGWAYLTVEALIWTGFALERRRGHDDRRAYRDLAWEEARFATGPRVDGDFGYYERMSQWPRSGAYDRDPSAPGLQPETDPASFNGDAWRLATAIFLGGGPADPGAPGYAAALAYYQDRAYGDGFLWDWSGRMDSLDRFRRLIDGSDTHLRNASLILGGAVANRLASGVDAFISQRTGVAASLRVVPARAPNPGGGLTPQLTLRVALP